jgi:cytochrome b561
MRPKNATDKLPSRCVLTKGIETFCGFALFHTHDTLTVYPSRFFILSQKQSFQIHKQLGVYGKFLIPAHVGAAFLHHFRGQTIFARINPFRASRG